MSIRLGNRPTARFSVPLARLPPGAPIVPPVVPAPVPLLPTIGAPDVFTAQPVRPRRAQTLLGG